MPRSAARAEHRLVAAWSSHPTTTPHPLACLARLLDNDDAGNNTHSVLNTSRVGVEPGKCIQRIYRKLTPTPSHITNHAALSFSLFVSSSRKWISDREEEDP